MTIGIMAAARPVALAKPKWMTVRKKASTAMTMSGDMVSIPKRETK